MNQGDGDLERGPARPTSSCPECARPGRLDSNQLSRRGTNSHHATGNQPLDGWIRYECSCGASWLCDAVQAHFTGEWLQRVGLYGLLSPPAREGLVPAPPESRGHAARLTTVEDHKKARPPKGTGR